MTYALRTFGKDRLRNNGSRPVRLLAAIVVALLLFLGIGKLTGFLHGLNPFAQHTTDTSQPALLRSINNLHQYRAASGHYEVIVELKKSGSLPSFVQGETRVFLGIGDVPAEVDFSKLGPKAVTTSPDRRTATLTLPEPTLATPQIDTKQSHLISDQRGLVNRVGGALGASSTDERDLYQAATVKMASAASADETVRARAEANTRSMLQGFLGRLGFRSVVVHFTPADAR